MDIKDISKFLEKEIKIYLSDNKDYSGYASEIVMPEEDDEIQEPILVLAIEGRKEGTIDGFYLKDIKSVEFI